MIGNLLGGRGAGGSGAGEKRCEPETNGAWRQSVGTRDVETRLGHGRIEGFRGPQIQRPNVNHQPVIAALFRQGMEKHSGEF